MITNTTRTMHATGRKTTIIASALVTGIMVLASWSTWATIAQEPLSIARPVRPIVMLALSNDHQLYKAAYDDYTDVDGDGVPELTYANDYEYFGYFDPDTCYDYDTGLFEPTAQATNHQCTDLGLWSGNFLNWASMSRMDLLRRVLYGGKRSTDTTEQTVLERALIPPDLHAFAKVFAPDGGATELERYTPYEGIDAITLCNVTDAASGESQSLNTSDNPPLIKVASGEWPLWAFTDASRYRVPCAWETVSGPSIAPMTGDTYTARVEACVESDNFETDPLCKRYPEPESAMKPIGMLQQFGDDKSLRFGLVTGSYGKNLSGGVLRRNSGYISGNDTDQSDGDDPTSLDELDLDTGVFTSNPGIIKTLDSMRINKYDFAIQDYVDNCQTAGLSEPANGQCTNWGNPVSEIVLEAMRYLAGKGSPTSAFNTDDSIYISGLSPITWSDPITSSEWCVDCNVLVVTGGVNSFDRDDLANDLSGLTVVDEVKAVGTAEGLNGKTFVLGGRDAPGTTNDETDGFCYARQIGDLSEAVGVCPSGGNLEGGWDVAGLSYFAHVNDLRADREDTQDVTTRAIDMGDGAPHFQIRGGGQQVGQWVTITPMCVSNADPNATAMKTSTLVDGGRIVLPEDSAQHGWELCGLWGVIPDNLQFDADGYVVGGDLYAFWEDTPYGSDSTLDVISRVHFCIGESVCEAYCNNNDLESGEYDRIRFCQGWKGGDDVDGGGNYTLPNSNMDDGELRITGSPVQVYSDRAISLGYVISGLKNQNQYNSDWDHCDNGFHGNGAYLEEVIPGTPDVVFTIEEPVAYEYRDCDALYSSKKDRNECEKVDKALAALYESEWEAFWDAYDEWSTGQTWFSVFNPDLGTMAEHEERQPRYCGRRFKQGEGDEENAPLLKPPLWYATKYGGFVDSNDNGTPDVEAEWNTNWEEDPNGDPDGYYMLYAPQNISDSFSSIFDLIAGVSSSSSVVANTFELRSGTYIYQGRFDSSDWSGDLLAFPMNISDGSLGEAAWSARDKLDTNLTNHANRVVMTSTRALGGGTPFRWSELGLTPDGLALQAKLNRSPGPGDTDTLVDDATGAGEGENRLNFIRGERDNELQNGGGFRDRTYLLGDIVNSDPIYVGRPPFNYPSTMGHSDYADFADCVDPDRVVVDGDTTCGSLSPRAEMLYVGANDGMLHGFDVSSGEEKFAYVPRGVYENLPYLPYLDYDRNHRFFVDGSVITGDIVESTNPASGWADTAWHTVLVGSLGAGGRGVFALDVTDPNDFSEVNTFTRATDASANESRRSGGWVPVFWDFTAEDVGFADLGYTFSAPTIVQTRENYWVAAFGNGYGSDNGTATLYFVKISGHHNGTFNGERSDSDSDHAVIADAGPGNGLSSVAPVDKDGDMIIDYVYAGDLKGNLWRFEPVSGTGSWTVRATPVFVATDENTKRQPITTRPAVYTYKGGLFVVFGTGKYFETSDAAADTTSIHSLYGVWDRLDGTDTIHRADLMPQSFIASGQVHGYDVRVSSDEKPSLRSASGLPVDGDGTHLGWYLDLKRPGVDGGLIAEGEMVAAELRVRGERVIFTTMIPSTEPCEFGGEGWLVELNYLTGGPPPVDVLFDLDGDRIFSDSDKMANGMSPNAIASGGGPSGDDSSIIQAPAIISAGEVEYKVVSRTKAPHLQEFTENPGVAAGGRASWQELE